ncbi:MAG: phenylalanine--tRNA ligase subunit beta [Opitutales bacterium]|nr:phenylalanine--tRNA ligase subunit beta [Opitutales bacterium]
MKISLNWLQEYVDLSDITVDDISHALTMVGFEVEGVEQTGLPPLEHVVVGEILSYEQHPNADRLSVCQVRVDDGEPRTIVCGAKNFKQNDRVIVALPGAVLPGDFEIKKSKLRGVASEGMMCSERELGMGEDHAGISILEGRPEIGTPVEKVFADSDVIFDVEVTPNRPDALSHIGIAREMAAWFRRDLNYPEITVNFNEATRGSLVGEVSSEVPELCPHYRGYSVKNVRVAESPDWLKKRLKAIGLRPINNIVDITNFVLHETGQPLHAFDASKVRGGRIVVRPAHRGEKLVTLDDKQRELDPSMMVIADCERGLVIAGVMGAVDAEVDQTTENIFLEAAYFEPSSVRRTARRLGLSTDSSYRFERGVDPKGVEYAALRCLSLILQLADGELMGPPVVFGEAPSVEKEIEISGQFIRERLGFEVSDKDIDETLSALELDVRENGYDDDGNIQFRVGIPSYRLDLYRPIDLVEEFLRIYGCDKIPKARVRPAGLLAEDDPVPQFIQAANALLSGRGFNEALHYSLRNEGELRQWYTNISASALKLTNPLSNDASHLRPSLIPGLLDALALNQSRHNNPRQLFETGRVFREENGRIYEMVSISFVILETDQPLWKARESTDFYHLSRLVLDLLAKAGVQMTTDAFVPIQGENAWQDGHAAELGNFRMGFQARAGLLNPVMTQQWDITGRVYAGLVTCRPDFLKRGKKRKSYKPFSAFPPTVRDLAVVVPKELPAGKVRSTLERLARKECGKHIELESVDVFDVYSGKGVAEESKSIACAFTFRSTDRTLTDKEVNEVFDRIQKAVARQDGMELRGA